MHELQAGQQIGDHYRLVRHIGKGGSSTVYEAYDSRFDRQVAIKFFKSSYVVGGGGADRLRREFRIMGRMRAPFLPTYFDIGEIHGLPWLAMELVNGESFKTRLQLGPVDEGSTLRILGSVAVALDFLHNTIEPSHSNRDPIIHRDVKPGNIICSENDPYTCAVLVDFGISKSVSDPQITEHGFVIGTGAYFAPEAYMSGRDERGIQSDQWSLAVVAWEGLTGISPSSDAVMKFPMGLAGRNSSELLHLAEGAGIQLPTGVFAVLERALAVDPQSRYGSCITLVREIDQALSGNDKSIVQADDSGDGDLTRENEANNTRALTAIVGPDGNPVRPVYLETEMLGLRTATAPDSTDVSESDQIRDLPIGGSQDMRSLDLRERAGSHKSRREAQKSSRSAPPSGADQATAIEEANDPNGVYLVDGTAELPEQTAPLAQRLRRLTAKYREDGYLE